MKPGGQHKLGGVTAAWPAVGWGRESLILGLGEVPAGARSFH